MKTIERGSSTQVLDQAGRLVVTYPTAAAADAFKIGYETGVRDAAEKTSRRVNELLNELKATVR